MGFLWESASGSIDNQLFDFYLNKNQIIIEKLTPKLIYENFIED